MKLDAEAFVWSNADAKPPATFATMSVPSHVLLSNEGKVENRYEARILNVWTGVPENTSAMNVISVIRHQGQPVAAGLFVRKTGQLAASY